MKKRLFLFLFVLWIAAMVVGCSNGANIQVPAEGPSSSEQNPPPLLTQEQILYKRAAALSQRFGLDIQVPKQNDIAYSHYDATALTDLSCFASALDILEQTLAQYPEGFFRQLPYDNVEIIRIELVGSLAVKDGIDIDPNSVTAFAQNTGKIHLIVFNAATISLPTLYHEFSHIIDAHLKWDSLNRENALYSEQTWLALQPEGFFFASSYTKIPTYLLSFLNSDFFISEYSLTFPTEDRATLMEAAMNNFNLRFEVGSGRRKKMQYYADCIRDCFDTTGWPETTLWEQVLK